MAGITDQKTGNTLHINSDGSINVSGGSGGGAVTIADGADVTQGAKADAAATSLPGSFSIVALLKAIWNSLIAPLPAGTNSIGTVVLPLPSAPIVGQVVMTGSAVQLASNVLQNGVTILAYQQNPGKVFVGGSGVTTTDTGSGNGYGLTAGQAVSFAVSNTNALYVIGPSGTFIYFAGN